MAKRGEVMKKITAMKLQEAANALVYVLEEHNRRFPGATIKKDLALDRIPEAIAQSRRQKGGKYLPSVENHEVRIADGQFARNHWSEIRLICEGSGYFIVWNPPGETPGIRLGTIEEYKDQQGLVLTITTGFARFHNKRTQIIEDYGEHGTDITVKVHSHELEDDNG